MSPAAMNALVIFACLVAGASARPGQLSSFPSNFDTSALQNTFSNLPSAAAGFETGGAIGGLAGVGDRIATIILDSTPADQKESVTNIIKLSDGFLDGVGSWFKSLPPSAFEVPKVDVPQYVAPKFEVPENFKFSDIKIPEFNFVVPQAPQAQAPRY
ncbi:uncharacterized protein LOC108664296 [Hyalella azteca]|uniref:Uncharacterized protein LOC108664296 n=1 Tax=Hyalella azteca TaxID=294128 RepID=A0A8B7MXX3_HYAAZ|nr:uncharacterized protein LOC108664296 [Hyalella azteca]